MCKATRAAWQFPGLHECGEGDQGLLLRLHVSQADQDAAEAGAADRAADNGDHHEGQASLEDYLAEVAEVLSCLYRHDVALDASCMPTVPSLAGGWAQGAAVPAKPDQQKHFPQWTQQWSGAQCLRA